MLQSRHVRHNDVTLFRFENILTAFFLRPVGPNRGRRKDQEKVNERKQETKGLPFVSPVWDGNGWSSFGKPDDCHSPQHD